jgi:hypothetical protein
MSTTDDVASAHPLLPDDPPRIGQFLLRERLVTDDAAVVFRGVASGEQAAVVLLTAGADDDPAARGRFRRAVDELMTSSPESVAASDFDPEVAPWIAIPLVGGRSPDVVHDLLNAVTMRPPGPSAPPRGPDFVPHWHPRRTPGRWRLWPLPWPAAGEAASRVALLWALALVMVLATLAVLIAIWLFRHQPPSQVPLPQNSPQPGSSGAPSQPTSPSSTGPTHPSNSPTPSFTNSGGSPTNPPV